MKSTIQLDLISQLSVTFRIDSFGNDLNKIMTSGKNLCICSFYEKTSKRGRVII